MKDKTEKILYPAVVATLMIILLIAVHNLRDITEHKTQDRWSGQMEQHRFTEITNILSKANIDVSSLSTTEELQNMFPIK